MLQIALVAATVIVASGSTSGIASYFLKVMPKGNKNISIYVIYIQCPGEHFSFHGYQLHIGICEITMLGLRNGCLGL